MNWYGKLMFLNTLYERINDLLKLFATAKNRWEYIAFCSYCFLKTLGAYSIMLLEWCQLCWMGENGSANHGRTFIDEGSYKWKLESFDESVSWQWMLGPTLFWWYLCRFCKFKTPFSLERKMMCFQLFLFFIFTLTLNSPCAISLSRVYLIVITGIFLVWSYRYIITCHR